MNRIEQHPILVTATLELAYDNGAVNRERTEAQVIESCSESLVGYSDTDLAEVTTELDALNAEDLGTVLTGDQDDPVCKALSRKANELLNTLFEAL